MKTVAAIVSVLLASCVADADDDVSALSFPDTRMDGCTMRLDEQGELVFVCPAKSRWNGCRIVLDASGEPAVFCQR